MTIEETKRLLLTINTLYPNWKVEDPEATTATWYWVLKDYSAPAIMRALHNFAKNSKSGFAPSVSQLIENISFIDKLRPETRAFIQELDGGSDLVTKVSGNSKKQIAEQNRSSDHET